jgi:hypothetical protein
LGFNHIAIKLGATNIPKAKKMRYSFSMTHRKDGAFFMAASISQELLLFAEELRSSLSSSSYNK